jgi:hypothetical protein
MVGIRLQLFGLTLDGAFRKPVLYRNAHCVEVAEKCLEAFGNYGLKPTQVRVQRQDEAFNYELSFSLFNGNGTFKLSAETLRLEFQNANGRRDIELLTDCIVKAYQEVPIPEITNTVINANGHATMSSEEEAKEYLLRYARPEKGISAGGMVAFMNCRTWPQTIRLLLEGSLAYPAGVFLNWSTRHPGSKMSREAAHDLEVAFEESVTKLDLRFVKDVP